MGGGHDEMVYELIMIDKVWVRRSRMIDDTKIRIYFSMGDFASIRLQDSINTRSE